MSAQVKKSVVTLAMSAHPNDFLPSALLEQNRVVLYWMANQLMCVGAFHQVSRGSFGLSPQVFHVVRSTCWCWIRRRAHLLCCAPTSLEIGVCDMGEVGSAEAANRRATRVHDVGDLVFAAVGVQSRPALFCRGTLQGHPQEVNLAACAEGSRAPLQGARDVQELHPHGAGVLQCLRHRHGKGGAREACPFVGGEEALQSNGQADVLPGVVSVGPGMEDSWRPRIHLEKTVQTSRGR